MHLANIIYGPSETVRGRAQPCARCIPRPWRSLHGNASEGETVVTFFPRPSDDLKKSFDVCVPKRSLVRREFALPNAPCGVA
jgi:hypothetical protein